MKLTKSSFAKKLTASYVFVVAVTLLITGTYLTRRLKANFLVQLEQSLSTQALLMRDMAVPLATPSEKPQALHDLTHRLRDELQYRVTIIRADGKVIGDSDRQFPELKDMDNHGERPEVRAALASGTGEAVRYSRTLHEEMLYVAVPMTSSGRAWGVLRVALPLTQVHKRIGAFQNDLLKAGIAALIVAFLVAFLVSGQITRPLKSLTETAQGIGEGRFPQSITVSSRDEFGHLAATFGEMSRRIEDKVQELSQERGQLSAILTALVEGVVALDHEGRVLFLNPAAEKLFQVPSDAIKGRAAREVLRHNALHEVIQRTLANRQAVTQEISIHFPQERSLIVHVLPVSYGHHRTGALAALQDITELRKLEKVRQEFVANVSHELKTPLTAIKGYVETLLEGALEDKNHNREFLKIIEDHTKHLSLLIDDVLNLSAIEAKRVEFKWEAVSLSDITARLIKGLAPMAKAKDVKIENKLSDKLPKVRADRDKLAQILMNLIDNAIKFNKTDGRIEINAVVRDRDLVISVADTGPGIAPDDLPRVFERFYRADKAHSREITGTGLGLAIVKHLVESHQGTVTVQSQLERGATFTFTLPLA